MSRKGEAEGEAMKRSKEKTGKEKTGKEKPRKRARTTCQVMLAGTAVFLITGGILLWQGAEQGLLPGTSPRLFESNAVPTPEKLPAVKEIKEQLQEQADASSFRFQMNTRPVFADSSQAGDWCIINSIENRHHMVVVVKDDRGRELYRSQELKPGEQEMTGYLKEALEPGEYRAEAAAFAIDPETGEVAGSIETDILLTVEASEFPFPAQESAVLD